MEKEKKKNKQRRKKEIEKDRKKEKKRERKKERKKKKMKKKEENKRKLKKRKKAEENKERKKGLLYQILNLPTPPCRVLTTSRAIKKGSLISLKLCTLKVHNKLLCAILQVCDVPF